MLGVRLDDELERRLSAVARRLGRSKSDIAREAVRRYVDLTDTTYLAEARRQSLSVGARHDADDWRFFEEIEAVDGAWR